MCVVNNRKFEAEHWRENGRMDGRKDVMGNVCGVFFVSYMMISSIVCVCVCVVAGIYFDIMVLVQ